MKTAVLVHDSADDVGVAVRDIAASQDIGIMTLEGQAAGVVRSAEAVPLGHKIALRDLVKGRDVLEYGQSIGRATRDIRSGSHVHVHNLKSQRW